MQPKKLETWEKVVLWLCGIALLSLAALTGPLFADQKKSDEKRKGDVTIRLEIPEPPEQREPSPSDSQLAPPAKVYRL